LRGTPLLRLKPCHACGPMACLSGVHSLTMAEKYRTTAGCLLPPCSHRSQHMTR
jgi:hypothetical protein